MIIKTNEVIFVPQGSINKIITHLKTKNYSVSKVDSFLLRFLGSPQSGWIYIGEKKLRRGDFLYKLTTAKAAMVDVTLIPGETTYYFLRLLAEKLTLDITKLNYFFHQYSPYEEGAFVPDTYKLPLGINERMAVGLLLKFSHKKQQEFSQKVFGNFNQTKWLHYLVIASIIQKESASKEEMPVVASVIYNRLKKGMKLQMDGSLNYGRYSHTKITAKRLKSDKSRYNTYRYKSLPPYPVCNVGFNAIRAAIFPAQTTYLYFVKQKNGKHAFSSSYNKHRRNILSVSKSSR